MRTASKASEAWRLSGGIYRDSRLDSAGIPHGVTTRLLGDMKDAGRRSEALESAGLGGRRARLLRQEHGTQVWEVSSLQDVPAGDGWICADPSSVACVYVADCLPIFLWDDRDFSTVGVFHAGWRGMAAGMPRAAVRAFRRYGLTPERLAASVGPHIGACCYAVGPDVGRRFRPEVRAAKGETELLDLGGEARLQLAESGVPSERISVSRDCTSCAPETFFSYRREKMDRRMLAFVALGGIRAH